MENFPLENCHIDVSCLNVSEFNDLLGIAIDSNNFIFVTAVSKVEIEYLQDNSSWYTHIYYK